MILKPSLILADEPTGNLDSTSAADIMDLLAHMNDTLGQTVIVVTHDPAIAERCHRRILVHDGRIEA